MPLAGFLRRLFGRQAQAPVTGSDDASAPEKPLPEAAAAGATPGPHTGTEQTPAPQPHTALLVSNTALSNDQSAVAFPAGTSPTANATSAKDPPVTTAPLTRLQPFVAKLADGGRLSRQEAAAAFEVIMTGEATDAQIAALLMGMRVRDETVDEIVGAAEIMRAKALGVTAPPDAIDTCGTGSDARGTFNISTCAAFVVAGAGVPVAKHGNKSITSRSGSSDVLTALGVTIGVAPEVVTRAIDTAGIGFMAAPAHHSATRHVMPIRAQLGIRTLLHILGPLSNPAGVKRQLLGVYDRRWLRPLAEVLGKLGSTRAWVVHGSDGLDELSTTGPSYVASLADGAVTEFEVTPEDAGVPRATLDQLAGGEPEENAAAIRDVLNGAHGAFRDIVVLNAGAALFVAGKAGDLAGGADLARAALDNGSALRALDTLVAVTNEGAAHG